MSKKRGLRMAGQTNLTSSPNPVSCPICKKLFAFKNPPDCSMRIEYGRVAICGTPKCVRKARKKRGMYDLRYGK